VLTIISFGALTLALHDEMLGGQKAALYLAAFIAVYWTTRIIVDFTYYEHKDWPRGRGFVVGHTLLTLLFVFLAATYAGLVIWHVWLR
jgi:hypothetical protein